MPKTLIAVALALMLCAGSPSPLAVVPAQKVTISLGTLIKVVHTDIGLFQLYSDPLGCTLVLNGRNVDRVSTEICHA